MTRSDISRLGAVLLAVAILSFVVGLRVAPSVPPPVVTKYVTVEGVQVPPHPALMPPSTVLNAPRKSTTTRDALFRADLKGLQEKYAIKVPKGSRFDCIVVRPEPISVSPERVQAR